MSYANSSISGTPSTAPSSAVVSANCSPAFANGQFFGHNGMVYGGAAPPPHTNATGNVAYGSYYGTPLTGPGTGTSSPMPVGGGGYTTTSPSSSMMLGQTSYLHGAPTSSVVYGHNTNVQAPGHSPGAEHGMIGTAGGALVPKTGQKPVTCPEEVPVMRGANGKFNCSKCQKQYSHAKHLRRHLVKHFGLRPYACELCGKAFYRPDIRKRHVIRCQKQNETALAAAEASKGNNMLGSNASSTSTTATTRNNTTSTNASTTTTTTTSTPTTMIHDLTPQNGASSYSSGLAARANVHVPLHSHHQNVHAMYTDQYNPKPTTSAVGNLKRENSPSIAPGVGGTSSSTPTTNIGLSLENNQPYRCASPSFQNGVLPPPISLAQQRKLHSPMAVDPSTGLFRSIDATMTQHHHQHLYTSRPPSSQGQHS